MFSYFNQGPQPMNMMGSIPIDMLMMPPPQQRDHIKFKVTFKDVSVCLVCTKWLATCGDLQEFLLDSFYIDIKDVKQVDIIDGRNRHTLGDSVYSFEHEYKFNRLQSFEMVVANDGEQSIFQRKYTNYIQERDDARLVREMIEEEQKRIYEEQIMRMIPRNELARLLRMIPQPPQMVNHKILATQADLDSNLKVGKYDDLKGEFKEEVTQCLICSDDYVGDSEIAILKPCKKCVYHHSCIKHWLTKESHKCPVCRIPIGEGKRDDLLEETEGPPEIEEAN